MSSSGQRRKRTIREPSSKRNGPDNEEEEDGQAPEPEEQSGSGSGGNRGTKKQKKKRFVWTDNLHKRFVAAIFDHGLRTVTPKILFDLMNKSADDPLLEKQLSQENDTASSEAIPSELTSDHIKSHLQKYRANVINSRREFLYDFERASEEAQTIAEYEAYKGTKVFPPNYSTYPVSLPRQYQHKEYPSNVQNLPPAMSSHFVGDDDMPDGQNSTGFASTPHAISAMQQQRPDPTSSATKPQNAWEGAHVPLAASGPYQHQHAVPNAPYYGQAYYPPQFYGYRQHEHSEAPVHTADAPPSDRLFLQPQMYSGAPSHPGMAQPSQGVQHSHQPPYSDPNLTVPAHTVGHGFPPYLNFNGSFSGAISVPESQGRSSDGAHSEEGRHRSVSDEVAPVDLPQREQHVVDQLQHLTRRNDQAQVQQGDAIASAPPETYTDTYSKDGKPIAAVMLRMQSAIEAHRNISYAQQLYQNKYAGMEDRVADNQPRNHTELGYSQRPRPQQSGRERDPSTFNLDGAGGESDGLSDCSTGDSIFGASIAPGTSPPMGPSFATTEPRHNSPNQRENIFGFLEGQ